VGSARIRHLGLGSARVTTGSRKRATDGFTHLHEDDGLVQFLAGLHAQVRDLAVRHEEQRGCGLRIVFFSDHG
jgi:hypothetical protein